jgi:hypothetical protein
MSALTTAVGASEAFVARIENLIVHQPLIGFTFEVTHLNLREDFRAVIFGIGQIVHEHGVLRAVVATRHAVAAQGASRLLHADLIDAILEGYIDRQMIELAIEGRRRFGKRLQLGNGRETFGIWG